MSDALHTVALTLPGTQTRLLVERLVGSTSDAPPMAVEVLREMVNALAAGAALRTTVIRSDEIVDVPFPPLETT